MLLVRFLCFLCVFGWQAVVVAAVPANNFLASAEIDELQAEIAPFITDDYFAELDKEIGPLCTEFTDPAFLYKITHAEEIKQAERQAFLNKVLWEGTISDRHNIKAVFQVKDLMLLGKGSVRRWMDYRWYKHFYDHAVRHLLSVIIKNREAIKKTLKKLQEDIVVCNPAIQPSGSNDPRQQFLFDPGMIALFSLPFSQVVKLYGSAWFLQRLTAGCLLVCLTDYYKHDLVAASASSFISNSLSRMITDWKLDTRDRIPGGCISTCSQMVIESSWQPAWARGLQARWAYEIMIGCSTLYAFHHMIMVPQVLALLQARHREILCLLDKETLTKQDQDELLEIIKGSLTCSFSQWLYHKRTAQRAVATRVDLLFSLPGWYRVGCSVYDAIQTVCSFFKTI